MQITQNRSARLSIKDSRAFLIPKIKKEEHTHAKVSTHHPAGAAIGGRKEAAGRTGTQRNQAELPQERNEIKLNYHRNRLKALEHEEKQLYRKARNHRIFTRGGMLEAFLLKPTLLTDEQVHSLLKVLFHKPETNEILNRMIADAEKRIEEDADDGKTL